MKYYIINHRDNEIEGHQSNLDRNDNNFNFNDDYDDDAQNFFKMFILFFHFYYDF